jgi:hypothetical protein
MHRTSLWAFLAALIISRAAGAALVNFDFTETYQTSTVQGELIGLNLDANGNGTNVDPTEVLLFAVPPNVGITASVSSPYTFIPHTFEQYHEDNFTHLITLLTTTTSGVYGFNVANFTVSKTNMDLTLADAANQVNLFFNAGGFTTQGSPEYGIIADGENDYYLPTVNTFVSFTAVPEPGGVLIAALAAGGLMLRRPKRT